MPLIFVEFEDSKISNSDIKDLCVAIQEIVSEETGIEDVAVYANTAQIKVQIAPVEIFIQMSTHIMDKAPDLMDKISIQLTEWKSKNKFLTKINMTLIPMKWQIKIGI